MTELIPNTIVTVKHLPVVKIYSNIITVEIGAVPHSIMDTYYIIGYISKLKRAASERPFLQMMSQL